MALNMDMNGVQNSLVSAYHTATAHASKWMGRTVAILKSHIQGAFPYLQDKRIAAVSLIGVNLVFIQLGEFFSRSLTDYLSRRQSNQKLSGKLLEAPIELATAFVGVVAFAKCSSLPFSWLAILGISVGTIFARQLCIQKPEAVSSQ